MISLRDNGGTGTNRNKSGPTYWTSDNDDTARISNWNHVTFAQFRKALTDACSQFPDLDQAHHEEEKHVALLVHGYNNPWPGSVGLYRTVNDRLFVEPNGLGICVLLTWPSKGAPYDYLADRDDVRQCANDLADILTELYQVLSRNQTLAAKNPAAACKAKVSIIAHSMGNFLVQVAMFHLWQRINAPLGLSLVNQLLMIAADVDNDVFDLCTLTGDGDGEGLANLAYRITALYTGLDPILAVSAGLKHFLKRRLGRSGLDRTLGNGHTPTPDNVWDTDCTDFLTKVEPAEIHGAYFSNDKVYALITQVLRGVDRGILVRNGVASANSWWANKVA
jgi:esterase/lipase superfamily enzyme